MLVLNPMTADSRVDKEASALGGAGHDVTVVATAAPGLPAVERRAGYRVLRLPYRRVVKDRVVGLSRALAAEGAARRSLLGAARAHGAAGAAWDAAHARHAAGAVALRAAGAAVRLGGGAWLKAARTGLLPVEYWRGTASALPRRVARPDVLHAHDLGTLAAAVRLARHWHRRHPGRPRPRVVYDSHELYVEQQTRWTRRERLAWRAHEARWIRRADLVVTVSDGIADELTRRYRLRARPLVLFNSPDVERAGAPPRALRDDVGADGTPLVAYAGTVKAGRGVGLVVDAMAHSPAWHLALVGPGSSTGDVLDRAAAAGVAGRVHVLPAVPAAQLPGYLRSADLGVHLLEPTCRNHELALPNKLFDYVAAGLPVVVSRLPEMAGFVERHGLGLVAASLDAPAVGATIDAALRRRAELAPGPAVTRTVAARYGWPSQRARLLAAYEDLLR